MTFELRLILGAFACYRLALLVSSDTGPFDWFLRFRRFIGRAIANDKSNNQLLRTFGDLIHCPFCSGVWFAAALAVLALWPNVAGDFIFVWLGLAGVQNALQKIGGNNGRAL